MKLHSQLLLETVLRSIPRPGTSPYRNQHLPVPSQLSCLIRLTRLTPRPQVAWMTPLDVKICETWSGDYTVCPREMDQWSKQHISPGLWGLCYALYDGIWLSVVSLSRRWDSTVFTDICGFSTKWVALSDCLLEMLCSRQVSKLLFFFSQQFREWPWFQSW